MSELITLDQAKPEVQRKFMAGVYFKMVFALALTALVAYFTAYEITTNDAVWNFYVKNVRAIIWTAFIAEFGIVLSISFAIRKISPAVAYILFFLYSAITGITLSSIFILFQIESIFKVFVVSALMFLGMSIYGAKTQSDLRSAGRYLTMALIGLVITGVFNLLFKSPLVDWIINLVGVGVFIGLTAYDTQKLMNIGMYSDGSDSFKKYEILGALELYLDFINIFLKMLSLFGKRRK